MRRRTLLTRVLVANLLLISVAVLAAGLAANPNSEFRDEPTVGLVLGFAIALTVLVNLFMIQRRFEPLERVIEAMEKADLARSGVDLAGVTDGRADTEEVERLELAFRRMLERLDAERRRTSSATLKAMEEERARVARELHDEVNQSLTGLLLHLEAAREKAPPDLDRELAETKALANGAMHELLTLARALRPTALDDLGLRAALGALVDELGRKSGISTRFEGTGEMGDVPTDTQLVAYRVAQEALSNAAQHSKADRITVRVDRDAEGVELSVADNGRGFTFDQAARGLGISGMRERALLVGGDLGVTSRPDEGTRVSLKLPIRDSDGNDAGGHEP
jgi:two-component system, NarL family, sensor histidine kinase UhpB